MAENAENAAVNESGTRREIRSRPHPDCLLCGARGEMLYAKLRDRLFDAPGEWSLRRCPNASCGLIWLDPMPLEEDIGIAYETYFTHAPNDSQKPAAQLSVRQRIAETCRSAYRAWRYNYGPDAGKPLLWLLALPILLTRIECDNLDIPLRYLAVEGKGRMLDVGCGNGAVLELARELGWDVEGVDFDLQAVENARRKGLPVKLGTLADQHYSDESFDLVLMSHVIEHVHDPLGTLCEIKRILRQGGSLVVTTPNADSFGHRLFRCRWAALDPPRHLRLFNANVLAGCANCAGFRNISVSSTLRITPSTFFQSALIRAHSRGNMSAPKTRRDIRRGRVAALRETLLRMRDPFSADELLLEARR